MNLETKEPRVRVLTNGGVFLRSEGHSSVVRSIRQGRYKIKACTRRKILCVIDPMSGVSAVLPAALKSTYREPLGDIYSVLTLKRIGQSGELIKYDPGLKFDEIGLQNPRRRIVSAATVAAREARRNN